MSKVDEILFLDVETSEIGKGFKIRQKQQLLAEVLDVVNSFEVESLPSDDPKLLFWQGYHEAQLDINKAVKERFK